MVTASRVSSARTLFQLRINLSSAFLSTILLTAFVLCHTGSSKNYVTENIDPLSPLQNKCFDTAHLPSWWSYIWCFRREIWQRHRDDSKNIIDSHNFIGKFVPNESHMYNEVYKHNTSNCLSASGLSVLRHAKVMISCCRGKSWSVMHDRFESVADLGTFIESVTEVNLCEYHLKVCSDLVCAADRDQSDLVHRDHLRVTNKFDAKYPSSLKGFSDFVMEEVSSSQRSGGAGYVAINEQSSNLERVRNMFHYGYDMYMQFAQPEVKCYHSILRKLFYSMIVCERCLHLTGTQFRCLRSYWIALTISYRY
jgi:Glucosidase II beta subunit-like protein